MSAPQQSTQNAYTTDWSAIKRVEARIDNLLSLADRFDHAGGSRRLAQRARDKAEGMETALRLLSAPENGVLTHPELSTPPGQADA